MTQAEKARKATTTIIYIVIAMLAGLLLAAFTAAEFGAEWGKNIIGWVEERWGITVSGGAMAAVVYLNRWLSTMRTKNEMSLGAIKTVGVAVGDAYKDLSGAVEQFAELKSEVSNKIQALGEGVANREKDISELKTDMAVIRDMLLVYIFKNSGDQTLNEIRLAYQESELLKNVRELRSLETVVLPEPIKQELPQIVAAARDKIEKTKKALKRL